MNTLDSNAYWKAAAVMGTCPDGPTDDLLQRAIVAYLRGGRPLASCKLGPERISNPSEGEPK